MGSNPMFRIFGWGFISKTYKILINHIFMMKNIQNPHIFTPPRPQGCGGVKIWGLLSFGNYKIKNNDFIAILESKNLYSMMFTTL